jgi:hypothetical protein
LAAREADRASAQLRSELRGKWVDFLRARDLDEELERATTARLKDEYFEAIEEWGRAAESCEPDGVNRRWLPRLVKAFGKDDVVRQREDIARILGALAADRLASCAEPAADRALRAERELNALVGERLRLLTEFFDGLEPGTVRASTRLRVSRLEKGLRSQRPLADRSVSLGALRLKTAAARSDPGLVEHLESDPAFQKPFALKRALAQLGALDEAGAGKGPAAKALSARREEPNLLPAARTELKALTQASDESQRDSSPTPQARKPSAEALPMLSEPLSTPWLLQ